MMDRELPCGVRLEVDWALQHPQDYLDVLTETVPAVLRQAGIAPQEVIWNILIFLKYFDYKADCTEKSSEGAGMLGLIRMFSQNTHKITVMTCQPEKEAL